MAIAYRSHVKATGTGTPASVAMPSGVVEGDHLTLVLVADQGWTGTLTVTWPEGFTQRAFNTADTSGSSDRRVIGIATKDAVPGESGPYSVSFSGSTIGTWTLYSVAFNGNGDYVNHSIQNHWYNPFDTTTSLALPSITMPSADGVVLAVVDVPGFTPPSLPAGMTSLDASGGIRLAYEVRSASGATGTRTSTFPAATWAQGVMAGTEGVAAPAATGAGGLSFNDGFYSAPILFYGSVEEEAETELAGVTGGTSAVAGNLSVARPLAGVSTGMATDVASTTSPAVVHPLDAGTAGVSTVTPNLRVTHPLTGAVGGVVTADADLRVTHPLAGVAGGISTASATPSIFRGLAGATAGAASENTGTAPSVHHPLAGIAVGASTATHVATYPQIAHPLAGVSTGSSSEDTGPTAPNIHHPLVAASAGVAEVSAVANVTWRLAAAANGESEASVDTVDRYGPTTPSDYGVRTYGTLTYGGEYDQLVFNVGATAGSSTVVAADLLIAHPFEPVSTAGTSTAAADLHIYRGLNAVANGTSVVEGWILYNRLLNGLSSGVSTVQDPGATGFVVEHSLDAFVNSTADATAEMLADWVLEATTHGESTVTGGTSNHVPLEGGTFEFVVLPTATADLSVHHPLAGLSAGVSTAVAVPQGSIGVFGIPSEEAFGVPLLPVVVAPIPSAEVFGTATLHQKITNVGGIPSAEVVNGPAVISQGIVPTGIVSAEAFGQPRTNITITPTGISSAEAVGTPATQGYIVSIGIPSSEQVSTPIIGRTIQVVNPTGIPSETVFGAVRTNIAIRPTGIPSAGAFGTPTLSALAQGITPSSISSEEGVGTPFVAHLQYVGVPGIPSEEEVGTPDIGIPTDWWSGRYPYRRRIVVSPATSVPVNHPVLLKIPAELITQGKIQPDFDDLEVIQPNGGNWLRFPREVVQVGDWLEIRFLLADPVVAGGTADYYIYYGNASTTGAGRPSFVDNPWPVQVTGGSGRIDFTRPEEHWRGGSSTILGAKAALEFVGTSVRVVADRSPANAIAEIQVDDSDWESVDLFSPTTQSSVEIYRREGLSPSVHRVRLRTTGRSNPSSRGKSVNVVSFEYVAPVTAVDMGEEVDERYWVALLVVGEE